MPEELLAVSGDLLIKYSIGLGIALFCLFGALWADVRLKRKQSLTRKITFHVIQSAFLCSLALTVNQYAEYAIVDYKLRAASTSVIDFITVLVIALIVLRQISLLITLFEKHQISKGSDPTSTRVIARMLKIAVFVVLLLMFGEHFGLSLSGLMAFGGIGGIAIGMAGKDILSNFFSGVMLYYDRPFNIGDWISSPDRNIEGTVVEIGWRITKIKTFDNRPLYVPNSLFSSISVQNPGRMTNRRINTQIGLRYEDSAKIRVIVDEINAYLKSNTDIDQTQTILVYFDAFADSSLNIMIYCFTKTTAWAEWLGIQQDVYLKIIDIVQKHGADFAYPTQTLYVNKQSIPEA
ncbi:mechanosensitive ion channel family protein [Alcaligenaceae bacterium 429]|uniref:mechanosensitive ion channel family protein n=1 Tax=Paenalcaligenes sp. Me52 TaxID=3392038 RepID=UPI001092EC2E|nr:mechanosensitive ion channel family protein [Alcaligenaceae bacterium 429]